jgi:hypothetical protein
MIRIFKTRWIGIAMSAVLGFGLFAFASEASAQSGHYSHGGSSHSGTYGAHGHSNYGQAGYGQGYRNQAPVYHAPSIHSDQRYHADSNHWTLRRGLHTHGHYDSVPHYVPGHIDTRHGGHIDPNPYYHGR